jgi:hypothetical protein
MSGPVAERGQRSLIPDFLPPAFRTASGGIPVTRRAQTSARRDQPTSPRRVIVGAGETAEIGCCDCEHGASRSEYSCRTTTIRGQTLDQRPASISEALPAGAWPG